MRFLNKSILLLLTGSLLFGASCGKNPTDTENSPETIAETSSETIAETSPENQEELDTYDIYVTIQNVDISLEDLKEMNYTVPVYITLDRNAGISYTEWGVNYDSRCQVEAISNAPELDFNIVASVNEDAHFLWTAWVSTNGFDHPGTMLKLNVTLPKDAALGDTYPITYAEMSLADKPHIWTGPETNWLMSGNLGWKDGGITIAETSTLTIPNFHADELS